MQLNKKTFVIFPGRFHPWHNGHKSVYNYLSTKFGGNDVYVTTTGVIELPKSPFSFDEKREMMMATGIPANKILNVKNNYNLQSVSNQIPINIERDSIIFAVSQKDMAEDPRFKSFVKKDGSPSYLQPMPKNESKLEPAIKHGYLITVPTTDFTVLGLPARSASQLRSQYSTLNTEQQIAFIMDLFGSYNPKIHRILNNKLGNTSGKLTEKQKKLLKKLIVGMLREDLSNNDFNNSKTHYIGIKPNVVKSIYNILKPMNEVKRQKLKDIIKRIIKEEDGFMNALIGPESDFKNTLNKINSRAGILAKAAQKAAQDAKADVGDTNK